VLADASARSPQPRPEGADPATAMPVTACLPAICLAIVDPASAAPAPVVPGSTGAGRVAPLEPSGEVECSVEIGCILCVLPRPLRIGCTREVELRDKRGVARRKVLLSWRESSTGVFVDVDVDVDVDVPCTGGGAVGNTLCRGECGGEPNGEVPLGGEEVGEERGEHGEPRGERGERGDLGEWGERAARGERGERGAL
jgi:hypothetical protein